MAFPSVRSYNEGAAGTETTFEVVLPATIESSDLLIVGFVNDGADVSDFTDADWNGWTSEYNANTGSTNFAIMKKVADGTEDSASLTVTTPTSEVGNFLAVAIKDWEGTFANGVEFAVTTGDTTDADPPSLNPAQWGIEDTLWIVIAARDYQCFTQYRLANAT